MEIIRTYHDFIYEMSISDKMRTHTRNFLIRLFSFNKDISKTKDCIHFPYYHHVFDDERKGFERQMKYLKNYGDFVSIDQAVEMLGDESKIKGRYFCLSFDDGYRCCYTNMMDIVSKMNIPAVIYLPTDFINLNENNADDIEILKANVSGNPKLITYLSWDQCREMLNAGITFGSHTKSHANLSTLAKDEIIFEMNASKQTIEKELSVNCIHFACPWGRRNIDFNPALTELIAKKLGYKSFATTNRGANYNTKDCFSLKRDHLLAEWGDYQLQYFLGK